MAVTLDYHNVRGCLTQAQINADARLNSAIGRLGGGVEVDKNVQEYQQKKGSVQNDISAKISQYLIAEDDIVASLDLLGVSSDRLDEIIDLLKELKGVAIKAESGNYSKNELNMQAIDIITELEGIRAEAKYNGIDLFGGKGDRVTFKPKHFNNEKTYWSGMNSTSSIKFEEEVAANIFNTLGEFVNFDTQQKAVVIRNNDGVEVAAFNFNKETTIGDFLRFFNVNGMKATISDGYISLSSTEGLYAQDLSSHGILAQLGITVVEEEITVTVGISATSATELTALTNQLANGSNKIGDIINITGSHEIVVKNSSGGSISQAFTSDNTINEMLNFLNANGINATIKNGIISLKSEGGEAWAIDKNAGGILEKMGITAQTTVENKTITKPQVSSGNITYTTVTATTSELTATAANYLDEIGFTSGFKITVGDGSGNEVTLDFGVRDKISDIVTSLNANGVTTSFADGKLTIDGTGTKYILSASGEFTRIFNLNANSYNKTTGATVTSSENIAGLSSTKKLNELGTYYSGSEGESVIKNQFKVVVFHNNQNNTVTINGTDSVQEVFNKLGAYGITGSISGNKVQFTSTNSYIKEGSEGLNAIFRIQNSYYKTTGINQTSGEKASFTSIIVTPTTPTADNSTRLDSLGVTGEQYVTVVNNNTKTEFTIFSDTTLGELSSQLSNAGIVCYFANGKFNISESENSYIKGMSAGLKTALKLDGAFSENVNVITTGINTTSPIFSITGNTQIAFEAELSSIGLATNEVLTVVQNGTEKTVTLNPKTTVRSMIAMFDSVGIDVSVENNKFTISGDENAYIKRIPSTLQHKLGIFGESYTTVLDTTSKNIQSPRFCITDTRILNTTDQLNKIGINGTQSIVISEKGVPSTITFTNTDTIKDVFNKLKDHGIDAEISKGNIKLTSGGASVDYVSSALKQALKLSVNIPKRSKQQSLALPNLGICERHIITIKGSTPKEKGDFSYDAALSFINLSEILDDGIETSGAKGIIENILYDVEKLKKEITTISGKLEGKLNRAMTERDAVIASYGGTSGTLSTKEMVSQILNSARNTLLETNAYDTSEARKLLNAR